MTYAPQLFPPLFGAHQLRPALRHSNPLLGMLDGAKRPPNPINPAYARTARTVLFPDTRLEHRSQVDTRPYVPGVQLPSGVVVWEGPSRFDGEPIVIIWTSLVRPSQNKKTGDMLQSWILRSDVDPKTAARTGADASICATCPRRPSVAAPGTASCYVDLVRGPGNVYEAYRQGRYPRVAPQDAARLVVGRALRAGAYGDPAATPIGVWMPSFLALGGWAKNRWTGYTHQWCQPEVQVWRPFLMASCDTEADKQAAQAMGWRAFIVGDEPLFPGERRCPASAEAGNLTKCNTCLMCSGAGRHASRPHIVIKPH